MGDHPVEEQQPTQATVAGIRGIVRDPQTNRVQINYDRVQRASAEGDLNDPRIQELLLFAAQNNTNSGLRMDSVDLLTQGAGIHPGDKQVAGRRTINFRTL